MERGAKYENSESLEIEIYNSVDVWGVIEEWEES